MKLFLKRSFLEKIPLFYSVFSSPQIILLFFLGIAKGIPISFSYSTVTLWLASSGINKFTIGVLSFATFPYLIKFLWAPFLDKLTLPLFTVKFGRRKGTIIFIQLLLILSLISLGFNDPNKNIIITFFILFIIALFSASQEVITDAYRIELLTYAQQGNGFSVNFIGHRIGALISYSLTPVIADYACYKLDICTGNKNWIVAFSTLGSCIGISIIALLFLPEPAISIKKRIFSSIWKHYFLEPLVKFAENKHWLTTLFFIFTYKISNQFTEGMLNVFWIEIGFSLTQVGGVVKLVGLLSIIIGSLLGTKLLYQLGVKKSCVLGIFFSVLTHSILIIQYYLTNNIFWLYLSVSIGSITGGLMGGILVTYLELICKGSTYTSSQFALLSSISNSGKIFLPSIAGYVASSLGWVYFFLISIVIGLTPLIILALPLIKVTKLSILKQSRL